MTSAGGPFLDRLQTYLRELSRRPQSPAPSRTIALGRLRQHLLSRLGQLAPARVESLHARWSEQLPQLALFLEGLPESELSTTPDVALHTAQRVVDIALGLGSAEAVVELLEADRLFKAFQQGQTWKSVARYSAENQLTRVVDARSVEPTALATTLQRLTGKDAVRWLLTIETERSLGDWDDWRVSRDVLQELLEGMKSIFDPDTDEMNFACSESTLGRLVALEVAQPWHEEMDSEPWKYDVRPAMRDVVESVLADGPWRTAVRAALEDETQHVVLGSSGSNVQATSEQSRVVTHEVRNALIPVRHHITELLKAPKDGARERLEKSLLGVNRVLRFVEDLVGLSEMLGPARLSTPLQLLLDEAIDPLDGSERVRRIADPSSLELQREPLVRALRNLVQNALQMAPPPAPIEVRATAESGQLSLIVDDGGPGVPVELRQRIFEDGFTTRPGGSGYGLAMTRRIARELGGTVVCEGSALGGARFVLRLPLQESRP